MNIQKEKNRSSGKTRRSLFIIAFIAPALVFFILFRIYPNLYNFYNALFKWDGVSDIKTFVGLKNFINMFDDKYFVLAFKNTMIFLVTIPPLTLFFSTLFAILLTQKIKRANFFKTAFYLPNILPVSLVGVIWIFLYSPSSGLVDGILKSLGLVNLEKFAWLGNPSTALYAMVLPQVWVSVGFYMVMTIAAINGIPTTIFDAAAIDGASKIKQSAYITIPLIWGTVKISVIYFIISIFTSCELILATTGGGPMSSTEVLGSYMMGYIMSKSFMGAGQNLNPNFGYASAIGVFTFMIILIITLLVNFILQKKDFDQ